MARGMTREQMRRKRRQMLRKLVAEYGGQCHEGMWVEGTYQGVTYQGSVKTIWASNGEVAMWPVFRLSIGDTVRTYNLDGPFWTLPRAVKHFLAKQQAST